MANNTSCAGCRSRYRAPDGCELTLVVLVPADADGDDPGQIAGRIAD